MLSEDDIKYNYNNNGNLIKKQSNEEIADYIYNVEGKLAEVNKTTSTGVETEKYKYNSVGTRIQKTTNGKEINYLVDENTDYYRVLEEKDDTGKLVVSYTYGHDLISQNRENNISLYYKDGLGSTTALGNVNGEVTDTYVYDAFGNITEKTGNTENSYLFAGEQLDKGTGQYYLRSRYKDPTIGRFTTMDSYLGRIQDPTSLHKYLYAHANPVNFTDPSGYMTLGELMGAIQIQSNLMSMKLTMTYITMTGTVGGRLILEISQEVVELMMEGDITLGDIPWSMLEVA